MPGLFHSWRPILVVASAGFWLAGSLDLGRLPAATAADVDLPELTRKFQILAKEGHGDEATVIGQQLLAAIRAERGAGNPAAAPILRILGKIQTDQGHYDAAKPLLEESLAVAEKALGPEHPATATILNQLAILCQAQGDLEKAQGLLERALEIREKALGPGHRDTAASLSNLALVYYTRGDSAKALPLLERAREIREQHPEPETAETGAFLNNLALVYHDQADFTKARPLYEKALAIRERWLGPESRDTATTINNLALLHHAQGDYAQALPLYERALKIREKALGPKHPDWGVSLNNLAGLYRELGDHAKALPLYEKALRIREDALGPNHPDLALSLNNLAGIHCELNHPAQAAPLYERALSIRERVWGPNHRDTADSLDRLAVLRHAGGQEAQAVPLLERALRIRQQALGPEHPCTAQTLHNLGLAWHAQGEFEKASSYGQQALDIFQKTLGPEHADTAAALETLGLIGIDLGQPDRTLELARRRERALEKNLGQVFSLATERQRLIYAQRLRPCNLFGTLGSAPDLADVILRHKGVVLDSLLEDDLAARATGRKELREKAGLLRRLTRQLAQAQIEIPSDAGAKNREQARAGREALEQRVEGLQRELAAHAASVGKVRRALRVEAGQVRDQLPADAVLVEFIRYHHYLGKSKWEARYGAVLIGGKNAALGGRPAGEPAWIPLAAAAAVDGSLGEYVSAMRQAPPVRSKGDFLRRLHRQLCQPIIASLPAQTRTLILAPDSELNFLNFATLVAPDGHFLAEKYTLKQVASGRDLVLGAGPKARSRRLVAMGNPAFAAKPDGPLAAEAGGAGRGPLPLDRAAYAGTQLRALPEAEKEALFLQAKSTAWGMQGAIYLGAQATETRLYALEPPEILHLATHGLFLAGAGQEEQPMMRLMASGDAGRVQLKNPMHRSGLALSGAQATLEAWSRGDMPPPASDGILTAQEVGGLDLRNTWLVVLSACDTGIGEVKAGEGVLGLRRGFLQAGAQNILMTLWPVSDAVTREVMMAFYEEAMRTGDAPAALAAVQCRYLVKLRSEKDLLGRERGPVYAAKYAGPFIMTYQAENP